MNTSCNQIIVNDSGAIAILIKCGSFQTDFRNSDGKPRRSKVLINLEEIDEELVYFIEF